MDYSRSLEKKDRIIQQLRDFISKESSWLTPDDQHAIERRIDELDLFITERYKTHGKPQ